MSITAVITHVPGNLVGMRRAAPNLASVLKLATSVVYVASPDESDEAFEISGMLGVDPSTGVCFEDNAVDGINRVIQHLPEGTNLLLLSADAVVAPSWWTYANAALMSFAAVGPVGPQLTGSQRVSVPEGLDLNGIMENLQRENRGKLSSADSLDHCCTLFSHQALIKVGAFDSKLSLRWSLVDWYIRLRGVRWRRPTAAPAVFGGRLINEEAEPLEDRLVFYSKYKNKTVNASHRLWATIIIHPCSRHQLHLLKGTMTSLVGLVDGVALVCDGPLSGFGGGEGPPLAGRDARLTAEGASGLDLMDWVVKHTGLPASQVKIACLTEETTGNAMYLESVASHMAREGGATWALMLGPGESVDASRSQLNRLMSHPDRSVVAYNVGVVYHWGSRDLCRIDGAYGDDGLRDGAGAGNNDCRLYRPDGSKNAVDGARVANVRIRNDGLLFSKFHRPEVRTDAMRMMQWTEDTSIGFHQLCYGGENLDDIARWLDVMHGVAARSVHVWTDAEEPPAKLCEVVHMFGGELVTAPGDIDFARWRNEGLRALEGGVVPTWSLFFDPDETVEDPVANLLCIRRLAESRDAIAFTVKATNERPDAAPTLSTSIRMARMGEGLKFFGKVHESLGRSITALALGGVNVSDRIGSAPLQIRNRGSRDDEEGVKHKRYVELVRQQLVEDPTSVAHWISLAWGYLEEGHTKQAMSCLDQACEHSTGTEFLGWYERGILQTRIAKGDLQKAMKRLNPGQAQHQACAHLLRFLGDKVPDLTEPVDDPMPLPEFLNAEAQGGPSVTQADDHGLQGHEEAT